MDSFWYRHALLISFLSRFTKAKLFFSLGPSRQGRVLGRPGPSVASVLGVVPTKNVGEFVQKYILLHDLRMETVYPDNETVPFQIALSVERP